MNENTVDVSEVTAGDPQATVPVQLVSGTVEVAAPRVAPRDGTIVGEAVYSDMHCPLLVDASEVDRSTVIEGHTDAEGLPAGRTVHRYPDQLVQTPTGCPTCGKIVEKHQLVPDQYGGRDCAIAINQRARGIDFSAKLPVKDETVVPFEPTSAEVAASDTAVADG
jgi:hypothetical protein